METSDSLFSKILANGPSPGTLFLVLSRMKEEGHLRRVIKECHHALDVYPNDVHIRRLLAESYLASGQIPQAESELEKVIARIDDLISSYSLKTEILLHQKRDREAVETLKLYLAHRPDDKEALRLLDTLEAPEEIPSEPATAMEEEAVPEQEVKEEVVLSPEEGDLPEIATPDMAEFHFDQGQIREAIETYEKVISRNPDDIPSRQRLDELKGIIDQDQGKEDKGEDRVRQKKVKMIGILEAWLANIREQSKTGLSVT